MNLRTRMTLAGATLATALILGGQSAPARAAAPVVGAARNVTINFVNADMVDVLKALATQTGSNIVAGPEVKGPVSVSMREVDLTTALDMITRLNNLAYTDVAGTYVVTTPVRLKEMFPTAQVTDTYTVTSMTPASAAENLAVVAPGVRAQPQGSSMVVLTGNMDDVSRAKTLLAQMEGAGDMAGGVRTTEIYELKYLNPLEAMRTLATIAPELLVTVAPGRRLPGAGEVGSEAGGTSKVNVLGGDRNSNSATQKTVSAPGEALENIEVKLTPGEEPTGILITGYPAAIARARALLDRMDVAPRQVEITARVVDLANTDAVKLGLQYNFGDLSISEGDALNDPLGEAPRAKPYQFGQFFRVPFNVGIQLDALATKGNTKILANPRIAAVSGRPARIFIGDTITAIISRDATTNGTTIATEKIHAGISLLVTPRVASDGNVTLEVHPTVSALTGLEVVDGVTLPQISERSVDTTIRVRDGETVAIGGLIREDEIKSMSRVPLLGDIPFFGELFRHRNNRRTRSDVTIFITTKIVSEA